MKLSEQLRQQGLLTNQAVQTLPKMESAALDALRMVLINQAFLFGYLAKSEERLEAATFNAELKADGAA